MRGKVLLGLFICTGLLFLCAFVSSVSASALYVPDDYSTIQAAVDATNAGDTIIVRDGTYIENVDVNKRLTIKSENGPASTIVQAADPHDNVFEISEDYVNISGFTVNGTYFPSDGIYLFYADYCNISNNNCSNNGDDGIALSGSNNNSISNNNCLNNVDGIRLYYSSNNIISNNNCSSNNWYGIYLLYDSSNNIISNNNYSSNNLDDIYLFESSNNKLTDNIIESGIVIEGDSLSQYTHEIDERNKVDGKPVYYWKDVEEGRIPDGAGQVILVNCTNITVENQILSTASIKIAFSSSIIIKNNNCSNTWAGILLDNSNNNSIFNNNCSNNHLGIYLKRSNDSSIFNNNNSNNGDDGISLSGSNNNSISNNTCSINHDGICLYISSSNIISNNNCTNNRGDGIVLSNSDNNTLSNNNCLNNRGDGIVLSNSDNNTLSNNNCEKGIPGFEIAFALAGLSAVAYLLRRRG